MSRIRLTRRRVIVSAASLAVAAAGAFLWVSQGGETEAVAADDSTEEVAEAAEEAEPAVPVEVRSAEVGDLPSYYHATGSLKARRSVDLIAKVSGQVTRLEFEEGDRVRASAPLVEIDPRAQALKVEESAVRVETSQMELARMQDMADRGLETDRAFEEASQSFRVHQAQHAMEQVRLEDHHVNAPFAGTITAREVELGQTVQPGDKLLEIADVKTLEVQLHLPEAAVARLEVGQPVQVIADAAVDGALEGQVLRIGPAVDVATSTVKVTLQVGNTDARIRPGSFVRAKITTDVHEGVVCIPRKALVAEAGADYVFVAEADTVRKIGVITGYSDDERIEIVEGLGSEDRVVTVGQGGLRTGARIVEVTSDGRAVVDDDSPTEIAQTR